MGIRIHKQLGYGLVDLEIVENGSLDDDPRINPEFLREEFYHDELHSYDLVEKFCKWIDSEFQKDRQNNECADIIRKANGEKNSDFISQPYGHVEYLRGKRKGFKDEVNRNAPFFSFDSEYGSPHVICFTEPFSPDWERYDDTIDYYMAEGSEANVKDLTHRCGIYPYISVIQIPGSDLGEEWRDKYAPSEYNRMVGRWDKDSKPLLSGDKLETALNCYRPIIPESILLWTYYIGIFKDWEKTVQELRPMIYTYWS